MTRKKTNSIAENIQDLANPKAEIVPTVPPRVFNRRLFLFRLLLSVTIFVTIILIFLAKSIPYFPIDLAITQNIQEFHFLLFDWLMKAVTFFGDNLTANTLLFGSSGYLFFKRKKPESIFLLLSGGGIQLISGFFKFIVGRPRPSSQLINQVSHFTRNDSFPSGHVLFFVGFFGFLLFLSFTKLEKNLFRKIAIVITMTLLILIGPSRIYLGAHWFSDVLGAYLIGFLYITVMIYFYNKTKPKTLK